MALIWFASAPLLLGEHHASLLWLLAWAMFWSPIFCQTDADRLTASSCQIGRILIRFSVSAAKIFIVLSPLYAAGWLIEL